MRIPVFAISQRHPKGLFCKTDRLYAQVAEFIYARMKPELSDLLDDNGLKRASISLALFLEDHFSDTYQMGVFMQWHQQKFHTPLPFYDYVDEATALIDQFKFVMWHAICAERGGNIINPENPGLEYLAPRILAEMSVSGLWDRLVPNEELADYLYSEETQTDIMAIKNVLVWIQHYSFLGYWYSLPEEEQIENAVDEVLSEADDSQRTYAINALAAFGCQAWPCSLKPQEIYARMIRFSMEDDNDPFARDIENIDCQKFAIYKLLQVFQDSLLFQDFNGHQFPVVRDSFEKISDQEMLQTKHFVGSFVRFKGEYHANGMFLWTYIPEVTYRIYCEERKKADCYDNLQGKYDSFIKKKGGQRIFFFADFKEYLYWLKKDLKLKDTEDVPLDDDPRQDAPLMCFFEPDGQSTLITAVQGIRSPHNPFFNESEAPQEALNMICSPMGCSPDCLHYLLENDLLPDAALNHVKGPEYGHKLVQQNAEFLARCFRRDIRW